MNKEELQKVSEETMRFMRGKYRLDEVPGKYYDVDCLKFKQGKRTILSINIHEDHYDFQIIYGKAEREKFEARLGEFPVEIQDLYLKSHALPDGLWMLIRVDNLETLEAVKEMIRIKKNPNRKPFKKDQAVHSRCGMRCDLCVHYSGGTISKELKKELQDRIAWVYDGASSGGDGDWDACPGCGILVAGQPHPCMSGDSCTPLKCAAEKRLEKCQACAEFDSCNPEVGYPAKIELRSISADDVTLAILPYVHEQYGN